MKNLLFVFGILALVSCNAYKDIPVEELKVGMSISQAQSVVKKDLVQASMSSSEEGLKEVYQVNKFKSLNPKVQL